MNEPGIEAFQIRRLSFLFRTLTEKATVAAFSAACYDCVEHISIIPENDHDHDDDQCGWQAECHPVCYTTVFTTSTIRPTSHFRIAVLQNDRSVYD
jgi:hypothetical protein